VVLGHWNPAKVNALLDIRIVGSLFSFVETVQCLSNELDKGFRLDPGVEMLIQLKVLVGEGYLSRTLEEYRVVEFGEGPLFAKGHLGSPYSRSQSLASLQKQSVPNL
jgi:hypothetical protein